MIRKTMISSATQNSGDELLSVRMDVIAGDRPVVAYVESDENGKLCKIRFRYYTESEKRVDVSKGSVTYGKTSGRVYEIRIVDFHKWTEVSQCIEFARKDFENDGMSVRRRANIDLAKRLASILFHKPEQSEAGLVPA